MPLKAYLRQQTLLPSQFARLVNATPSVVHAWLNGTIPSRRFMGKIFRVTNGNVDANDFYGLKPKPAREEAAE